MTHEYQPILNRDATQHQPDMPRGWPDQPQVTWSADLESNCQGTLLAASQGLKTVMDSSNGVSRFLVKKANFRAGGRGP